jgi:hypothetical protein
VKTVMPVILQKSRAGFVVMRNAKPVIVASDPVDTWKQGHEYRILQSFNRNCMEEAIRFAQGFPGFLLATLRETLGSWERGSFSPNPQPDKDLIAIYKVRKEGIIASGNSDGKKSAKGGRKAREDRAHSGRRGHTSVGNPRS